jgi:hypothetical protein
MNAAEIVILLAGIWLSLMIVRSVVRSWLGGPGREEMLREIDAKERGIELAAGGTAPVCPLCGAPTLLHTYPHITLWRCSGYPRCRGFVKVKKPSRSKFAEDWSSRNKRRI